ncbi:MAG: hypothetical protein V4568_17570 [Pseudomonadota bacterium]
MTTPGRTTITMNWMDDANYSIDKLAADTHNSASANWTFWLVEMRIAESSSVFF